MLYIHKSKGSLKADGLITISCSVFFMNRGKNKVSSQFLILNGSLLTNAQIKSTMPMHSSSSFWTISSPTPSLVSMDEEDLFGMVVCGLAAILLDFFYGSLSFSS